MKLVPYTAGIYAVAGPPTKRTMASGIFSGRQLAIKLSYVHLGLKTFAQVFPKGYAPPADVDK